MGDKGEAFYLVDELPPPLGVKMRVLWADKHGIRGPFDCVRWSDPKTRKERWSAYEHGELVHLPVRRARDPERHWIGWHTLEGARPRLWAPIAPQFWQAPLPAPAFYWHNDAVERMTYEKQEFSAADYAYEMEQEREALRANPDAGETRREKIGRIAWQPWRDETRIVWGQTPDKLTLRDCEYRLMRAIAICAAGRIGADAASITSKALANAIGEASDYVTDDAAVPLKPCQRDLGENFLEAMRWFTALGQGQEGWSVAEFSRPQKVLLWRSLPMPMSFAEIGELLANPPQRDKKKKAKLNKPFSGQYVREVNDKAIERAWRVGAGLVTTAAEVAITQLRERNRRVKRHALETA